MIMVIEREVRPVAIRPARSSGPDGMRRHGQTTESPPSRGTFTSNIACKSVTYVIEPSMTEMRLIFETLEISTQLLHTIDKHQIKKK